MASVLHMYCGQRITHVLWPAYYTCTVASVLHMYCGQCITHVLWPVSHCMTCRTLAYWSCDMPCWHVCGGWCALACRGLVWLSMHVPACTCTCMQCTISGDQYTHKHCLVFCNDACNCLAVSAGQPTYLPAL